MSRAFVKESDDAGDALPELSVSSQPNFVTPAGWQQIEARVAGLEGELRAARAVDDKRLLARIQRDLRYWTQRHASARVVPSGTTKPLVVRFGVEAAVRFVDDGTQRSFRLVGEDEADPANGLVSWVAPLGKALQGKVVGDELQVMGRAAAIVALRS